MNTILKSKITIRDLKLSVFLGWPQAERIKKQHVFLDVELEFKEPPIGCVTDNLKDTFCYADLVKTIQLTVQERQFHLIEHMGQALYQAIKHSLTSEIMVTIHITKKPAVLKYLTKGVVFSYGDG